MNQNNTIENVIIVDADYVDSVAFNLIVNFERMLGRRIPQADMARWVECVALDGGVRALASAEAQSETQVILIHNHQKLQMDNFTPSVYATELNGQAFKGALGEFTFCAVSDEGLATKESLFTDTLQTVGAYDGLKRLMVIPDERLIPQLRTILNRLDDGNLRITVFAMQPMTGGNFRQEILGYSLMQALGIHSDEISAALP